MATSIGIGVSPVFQLKKVALPSPDLYYDLSLKSNEHPTRNIIDDMSGNGRHATIYNALYAKGSGYGESGYEGAFVFDGVDDYARIENITKGFKTLFMEVVPFKTGGMLFEQRMMDAVQVGGRNLAIMSRMINGYINGGTGTTTSSGPDVHDPNYYQCIAGDKFISKVYDLGELPRGGIGYMAFYDIDKQFISSFEMVKNTVGVTRTATAPTGAKFYRYASTGIAVKIKLERGTKATDWSPAPEDVFAISNLPNTIAYNRRNPNGVTYINGELNTNKYTDDMQNHRQVITIVNPTDTGHGSASIGAAYNFSEHYSSMALYKVIGFYDELTPAQIQKVITKYNLKYEQI